MGLLSELFGGSYVTLIGALQPDDSELVARARRGDSAAYTRLVARYEVPLYNMALRMIGNPADAADVTQEALLRGWERIGSVRQERFKPWLFQVAVNLCRDHFRRDARQGELPQGGVAEGNVIGLGQPAPRPDEHAESQERRRLLLRAIETLDLDLRAALVLRDVNGLAYEEIAAALKIPLGTVKSRIARARLHVQEQLLLHPGVFSQSTNEWSSES